MAIDCTCGASLPDEARFCFRCGKPQREEDTVEPAIVPPPVASSLPVQPDLGRVTFNNPLALRTSILVACIITVFEALPFAAFVAPILGGFVSASLYQRRAGHALTPGAGAKLGWITSVFNALMVTIFITVNFLIAGSQELDTLRAGLRAQTPSLAQQQLVLGMLNDPRFLAMMALFAWIFFFAFSSLLFMAGGALGARFYSPRISSGSRSK